MNLISPWLWRQLVSVRLTITLVISLTIFCVIGTLVAQQGTTQVPIEKLYSPTTLRWFSAFGLIDIFHSPVFILLIFTLAMNLICCSIERLPKVWKEAFHTPSPPVRDPILKDWDPEEALKKKYILHRLGKGSFESVKEAKMATLLFFERHFRHYEVLRDKDDQFQIMVEKGKYSRLGVYVTHMSLLLIMFGGGLGAILGFEGSMSIEEGTRVSWMQHAKGTNDGMRLPLENGMPVPGFLSVPFEVECESFTLETYDGQRPKMFRSVLNFYENDVRMARAEISVNTPFVYRGITFYQASYNDAGLGSVTLRVFRDEGAKRDPSSDAPSAAKLFQNPKNSVPKNRTFEMVEKVKQGDLYRIDGDAAFRVVKFEANMMNLGPATQVEFFAHKNTKKPETFWIFQQLPGFDFAHRKTAKVHFVLDRLNPKFATGLSVARDPGATVVWLGCAIMLLAMFMAVYTLHSRYWVTYSEEDGFVVVGWSNKLMLFTPKFEKFLKAFQKEFLPGAHR